MKTYNILIQDDNGQQKWIRFEALGLSSAFIKAVDLVRMHTNITRKAWRLVSEIIPE